MGSRITSRWCLKRATWTTTSTLCVWITWGRGSCWMLPILYRTVSCLIAIRHIGGRLPLNDKYCGKRAFYRLYFLTIHCLNIMIKHPSQVKICLKKRRTPLQDIPYRWWCALMWILMPKIDTIFHRNLLWKTMWTWPCWSCWILWFRWPIHVHIIERSWYDYEII